MFVTGIIPCHNHQDWIVDALTSIARQDYPHKRIVVVDDGSTDDSSERVLRALYRPRVPGEQGEPWVAIGKLTAWDTEVMLVRYGKAHGPSFARNAGMKISWEGTDLFAFLDSDDLYEPGKISKSVKKFVEAPEQIGVVYSDYDTLSTSGLRLRQYKQPFSREVLVRECIVNCDSLVSKRAIAQCGPFDDAMRVCEDYDLWVRISEKFMITHIPESLIAIRVGEHSSSSQIPKDVWNANWRRVWEKAQARSNL